MGIARMEIAEVFAGSHDCGWDVGFLDVHMIDIEVNLHVFGADPLAHFDRLRGRVEYVRLVAVHHFEYERDVAFRRQIGNVAQSVDRLCHSGGGGRLRVLSESGMQDAADEFTAAVAAYRYCLLQLCLSASALLGVAAGNVGIDVEAEGKVDPYAVLLEFPTGEVRVYRARIKCGSFDEVEAHLGCPSDGARAFVVTPSLFPHQGMYAELVHHLVSRGASHLQIHAVLARTQRDLVDTCSVKA